MSRLCPEWVLTVVGGRECLLVGQGSLVGAGQQLAYVILKKNMKKWH